MLRQFQLWTYQLDWYLLFLFLFFCIFFSLFICLFVFISFTSYRIGWKNNLLEGNLFKMFLSSHMAYEWRFLHFKTLFLIGRKIKLAGWFVRNFCQPTVKYNCWLTVENVENNLNVLSAFIVRDIWKLKRDKLSADERKMKKRQSNSRERSS